MKYLYIIQQAMVWILTIYWVYQLIVSLCSLVKLKDKPLVEEKEHKFMAILPAHNEENVIGNLIESLKKQDYPANLIDIYVIADNCTDNTAKIVREKGACCYERFDDAHRTKGFALQFLFDRIEEDYGRDSFRSGCIARLRYGHPQEGGGSDGPRRRDL